MKKWHKDLISQKKKKATLYSLQWTLGCATEIFKNPEHTKYLCKTINQSINQSLNK